MLRALPGQREDGLFRLETVRVWDETSDPSGRWGYSGRLLRLGEWLVREQHRLRVNGVEAIVTVADVVVLVLVAREVGLQEQLDAG